MREIDIADLPAMQNAVGGYIEVVPGFTLFHYKDTTYKCVMLCDEEGKLKGKPFNAVATELWHNQVKTNGYRTTDKLVGDIVIIFGAKEVMAHF